MRYIGMGLYHWCPVEAVIYYHTKLCAAEELQHVSQRLQVPEADLPGGKDSSNQSTKLFPAENVRNTCV